MAIGTLIKQQRAARGETQGELAKALGITQAAVARYEKGNSVTIERLQQMCDHWQISLAELFGAPVIPNGAPSINSEALLDAIVVAEGSSVCAAAKPEVRARAIVMLYKLAVDLRASGNTEADVQAKLVEDTDTVIRLARK
ncbi:helix-turn-helix domain-containing protein [Pyruvatibacter mobilis]|uniref:helix-turn-helix domain-containing protein n=1 Tax=Pyruvatibacter mobilis TaxID=1712261 RepID=UPI003BAC6858